MDTYSNLDTSNWTSGFVSANRTECLRILSMINSAVEQLIREKKYSDAIIGMKSICTGLIKMEDEGLGDFDKQLVLLAFAIPAVAVFGLLDMDAAESTRREAALQYMLGMKTDPDHELASCYLIAKDRVNSYIDDLRSGIPLEQIKRKNNFPADLFDVLETLDRDFSVPSSYIPSSSSSTVNRSSMDALHSGVDSAFNAWMEENGWDEEDLERAYKRVKLRRNIYGLLSFTPLGLILFPFWLRSMYLTKAIKNRDSSVKLNIIAWIICAMYTVCTFFVYAAVMIWIIKKTNWGMGLGDRRALIPTFATVALVAFLIFQSSAISFPDIDRRIKPTGTTAVSDTKEEEPAGTTPASNTKQEEPTGTTPVSDTKQEEATAASTSVLTDQELLDLASKRLSDASDVEICIANAGFLEVDDSDYITVTNDWGYDSTFYRVIGYDTIAEAEEAAMELWYGTYSRRLSVDSSDHSMSMMRVQLMEHNGKLYRQYLGVGDDGSYSVVDYIVSRTDNEAVFSAHWSWGDYDDDVSVTPFQFSMVLEDGTWKFWKYLNSQE